MTAISIATSLRKLIFAAGITTAAVLGTTALGHLATADAKPTSPVIIPSDSPMNCQKSGGVWIWDGFERGHCEGLDIVRGGVYSLR